MSDETKKVELKLHPLIERLVEDPAAPPEVTELVGYLGKSTRAGHVRVYASLDLNEYTDVPEAAVRHAEEVPETELEHGGTRLWLDAKAEVVHEVRSTVRVEARFLEGAIAQAHLRKEAEPVAAMSEEEAGGGGEEEAFGAPETMLQPLCTLRCPITIQRTCPQTQCPASCRPMLTCNVTCPRTNCGATCLRTRCGPTCVTCPRTCLRTVCGGATCLGRTCPLVACLPRTMPPACYPREPGEPFGTPVTQATACPTRCGTTCQLTCPATRCIRTCATCLVTRCAATCQASCRPTCARTCQATCLVTRCQATCLVSCGRTCFRTCLCPVRTRICPIERTVACPVERTMACHGPEIPEIPEVGPFGAGYGGWEGGYYGDEGGYGYDPGDYDPYGGPWYGDDEAWET